MLNIKKHNNDCRNCDFFKRTAHAQPQGSCTNIDRFKEGYTDTHVFYNSSRGCKYWIHKG